MHGVHHESVPHFVGQVLVHHAGRGLSQEEDSVPGSRHDRSGLDPQRTHLHSAAVGMEGGSADRGVPQVPGKFSEKDM